MADSLSLAWRSVPASSMWKVKLSKFGALQTPQPNLFLVLEVHKGIENANTP